MELEQLVKLTKNLHDHFHMKKKTKLTEDEYRLCESLLYNNVDLRVLFRGLLIINNDIQSFGSFRVAKNKNG